MSLPDLPKTANIKYMAMNQDGTANGVAYAYTAQDMQAYGQTCREQAIEDAEKVCRLLADCEENTTDYRNGAAWCAERIRSLK